MHHSNINTIKWDKVNYDERMQQESERERTRKENEWKWAALKLKATRIVKCTVCTAHSSLFQQLEKSRAFESFSLKLMKRAVENYRRKKWQSGIERILSEKLDIVLLLLFESTRCVAMRLVLEHPHAAAVCCSALIAAICCAHYDNKRIFHALAYQMNGTNTNTQRMDNLCSQTNVQRIERNKTKEKERTTSNNEQRISKKNQQFSICTIEMQCLDICWRWNEWTLKKNLCFAQQN